MGPQELGRMGEAYVAGLLRSVGLEVEFGGPADLVVEGVPVEVKAARARPYRARKGTGYQFCLRKRGHTDHRRAVVVVLLAYEEMGEVPVAFVIPVEALGARQKVVIPQRNAQAYAGLWSPWRERWEVIADGDVDRGVQF